MSTLRKSGQKFIGKLAIWNPERSTDPHVKQIVDTIRSHYFPKIEQISKKKKIVDEGLSIPEAIKKVYSAFQEFCTNDGPEVKRGNLHPVELIAICKLAGENANGLRTIISLPKSTNQSTKILAFAPEPKWTAAKKAGATIVGSLELIPDILESKLVFDRCVASVCQMPYLTKIAPILGPMGMMPNLKTGTLTNDLAAAIKATLTNNQIIIDKSTSQFKLNVALPGFTQRELTKNVEAAMAFLESQNRTVDEGKFIQEASLKCGPLTINIAKHEFGHVHGPKFMSVLEKLREKNQKRDQNLQKFPLPS